MDQMERYQELEQEYAALDEAFGELEQQKTELENEYGSLLEQLKWTHSMLSILIEEQGGVITIPRETLATYDGSLSVVKVYEDLEGESYIIEVEVNE